MEDNFWKKFKKPIIGLSPMDGVTDAAFRYLTAKYGKPDLIFTEFTSAEGICAGAIKPLDAFLYDKIERPIIAQLFGSRPECFYKAFFVTAELGFDGVDVNMGCPSKNIATKEAGAGLILKPLTALEIIRECKKAASDWFNGKKIEDTNLPPEIIKYAKQHRPENLKRNLLPVSVKTRTGYNKNIIEDWIKTLLQAGPAAITIHGRTLKQMYKGKADWDSIAAAADLAKQQNVKILGNGDIGSLTQADEFIKKYKVDGVLIGRAALGNPWFFNRDLIKKPGLKKIMDVTLEHSQLHENILKERKFLHIRKHLSYYCRGFYGASEIRQKLMAAENSDQVRSILKNIKIDSFAKSR